MFYQKVKNNDSDDIISAQYFWSMAHTTFTNGVTKP